MTTVTRSLVIALLLLMGGCARLALMGSDDPLADMKAAQQAGDFQRALYFAENLDPEHPQYAAAQEHLPALRSAIREFELRQVRKAEAAADREQWREAYEILERAMAQWHASAPLLEAHQRIRAAEQHRRNEIHGALLLEEARWRIARDSLATQLQHLTDRTSAGRYRDWENRRRELARQLAELAEYFAERGDWDRVRDYLASARSLVPDAGQAELLNQARRELEAAEREYRLTRQRQQLQEARGLLQRYESTLRLEELLALRNFLRHHGNNEALGEMRQRVEKLSQQRFQQDLERGEALYARGQYQDAYDVWKDVAPLAPDSAELDKKLERAERVLSKLRALEER